MAVGLGPPASVHRLPTTGLKPNVPFHKPLKEMLLREVPPMYSSRCREVPTPAAVEWAAAVVLTALFLPGGPRGFAPPRRRWPEMLHALRAEGASLASCGWALRRWGFTEESLVLESPGLLNWAEHRLEAGEVLTAACSPYPDGWRRKLGGGAPPAVWLCGEMPKGPFLAVVGSRTVGPGVRHAAGGIGAAAAKLGMAVVSGGAPGCDRAAASGAARTDIRRDDEGRGAIRDRDPAKSKSQIQYPDSSAARVVEILPCGIGRRSEAFAGAVLSPFDPGEPFCGPSAMIRNALIYAMAEAAVVVHARFGAGGTWRGAAEANRRRLCPLIVLDGFDAESRRAAQALAALGARRLKTPSGESSFVQDAADDAAALADALELAKLGFHGRLPGLE